MQLFQLVLGLGFNPQHAKVGWGVDQNMHYIINLIVYSMCEIRLCLFWRQVSLSSIGRPYTGRTLLPWPFKCWRHRHVLSHFVIYTCDIFLELTQSVQLFNQVYDQELDRLILNKILMLAMFHFRWSQFKGKGFVIKSFV